MNNQMDYAKVILAGITIILLSLQGNVNMSEFPTFISSHPDNPSHNVVDINIQVNQDARTSRMST